MTKSTSTKETTMEFAKPIEIKDMTRAQLENAVDEAGARGDFDRLAEVQAEISRRAS